MCSVSVFILLILLCKVYGVSILIPQILLEYSMYIVTVVSTAVSCSLYSESHSNSVKLPGTGQSQQPFAGLCSRLRLSRDRTLD